MDHKSDIQAIKEEILNRSFFAFAFLGLPTLATSLYRFYFTGWTSIFFFQIFFVIILWGVYLFRKRLSLHTKLFSLNVMALTAGLWGAYSWGLAGGWLVLLTLPPVIFSLFYGKRTGLIFIAITTIVLISITVFRFNNGMILNTVVSEKQSAVFWINTIVTYLFLTSPLIILVGETSILLKNYIIRLKEKTIELEESNRKVLQTNKELLKAKKKAEESDMLKTSFLENISHEIRTPMNGILGFTELLRQADLSAEERNLYSDLVSENSRKFLSILDNVLYLSGLSSGSTEVQKEQIDLILLIEELKNRFAEKASKKGLSFITDIPENNDTSVILSDKAKIIKVLTELTDNAIKFTDKGSVTVGYHREGQHISFFVKDTGIGIPIGKKRLIFDRFTQADVRIAKKYGGAGMGLAITKMIAGILNGTVYVDSAIGKGSIFSFNMKIKEPESEKVPEYEAGF
jgi:signal transduction histidine kinase